MKSRLIYGLVLIGALAVGLAFFQFPLKDKVKDHIIATWLKGFSQESAETRFLSYATTLAPLKRLELAQINQIEIFERSSKVKLFWDRFNLPEVVVSATVPVEYRYYIDLNEPWEILISGDRVEVQAPEIRAGTPAPDVSKLRFEVQKGSLFRNEFEVEESLQKDLTEMLRQRAQESTGLVRETARDQVVTLVKQWLNSEAKNLRVTVRFANEAKLVRD